jgi:hypothetical protein
VGWGNIGGGGRSHVGGQRAKGKGEGEGAGRREPCLAFKTKSYFQVKFSKSVVFVSTICSNLLSKVISFKVIFKLH